MDIENKENYFPWMEEVVHNFAKYFMVDYDTEILAFLHRNIDEEIDRINSSNGYIITRSKALYKELTHVYEHMRLKMIQQSDLPNTTLSCVKLLSQLIRIGLILSQGLTDSEWIERILTALKLFSGKKNFIYDALLLVNGLKKIHHKPYALILKCILEDHHDHSTDLLIYMKIILLYRRLKALLPNKYREQCDISVTKIKPPMNLISWLKSLDVEESFHLPKHLQYKKIALHLMKTNLSKSLLKNLRDMLLNHYCFEDNKSKILSGNKEDQLLDMFVIDASTKEEKTAKIKVNSSKKNSHSQPQRKRKKPESLPSNDVEVEGTINKVSFINTYSNLVVENRLQLPDEKQSDSCINESNAETNTLKTVNPVSNEHKMSTKKKKKKTHRKLAKRHELEAASGNNQAFSDSAFCQSDLLPKKSKQICESNVTNTNLSPKRSISEDTENPKSMLDKDSNIKAIKKLKLLSNSKNSDEYSYNEISKECSDITPLHLLVDKSKGVCRVDFQNNLSPKDGIDDETNNKFDVNISKTKDNSFISKSPSLSEKLNSESEANNRKNIYFKKLMLKKITSETKTLCEQNQNEEKVSNLNILTKGVSPEINEELHPSNSTVLINDSKELKPEKPSDKNEEETVNSNNVLLNSSFENRECPNNFLLDKCSSVTAVGSEILETKKNINENNIPSSISSDLSTVSDKSILEKDVLCKDSQSPVVLESLSQKQMEDKLIKDTSFKSRELLDSSTELTLGSVPSENPHSSKNFLHLDCTVSSPKEKGWDRMKVYVDGSKSKIKIDIDIDMNLESPTSQNDSKSTRISTVEHKISGSTNGDAIVKETSSPSKNIVCQSSNLKHQEESSFESKARATEMPSEKVSDDKSNCSELINLENKILIECSSETSTGKTQESSNDGPTKELKSSLLHNLDNKFPLETSSEDIPGKTISSDSSSKSQSNTFSLTGVEHEFPSELSIDDKTHKALVSSSNNTSSQSKLVELSFSRHEIESFGNNAIDSSQILCSSNLENNTKSVHLSDLKSEISTKLPSENNLNEAEVVTESGDVSQSKSLQLSSIVESELAADSFKKGKRELDKSSLTSNAKQGELPDSEDRSVCLDKNSKDETCVSLDIDSKFKSKSAHIFDEPKSKDVSDVEFDPLKVCSNKNELLKENYTTTENSFSSDFKQSNSIPDTSDVCETTDKICFSPDKSAALEHASNSDELNKNCEKDIGLMTSKILDSETEFTNNFSTKVTDQVTNKLQTESKTAIETKTEEKIDDKTEGIQSSEEKTKIFSTSETCSLTEKTQITTNDTNKHSLCVFGNSETELSKSQNDHNMATVNNIDETSLSVAITLNDLVNDVENSVLIAGKADEQSVELQNNLKQTMSDVENCSKLKQPVIVDSNFVNSTENKISLENDTNNHILNKNSEVSNENNFTDKITHTSLQDFAHKALSISTTTSCNICCSNEVCICNKENVCTVIAPEKVVPETLIESNSREQLENKLEIKGSVISSTFKSSENNFSCFSTLTNNDCKQLGNNFPKGWTISNNIFDVTYKSLLRNYTKSSKDVQDDDDNCDKENTEKSPSKSSPVIEFGFWEKQTEFETLSDVSQKNKGKSINVDSGLKDSTPITNFSSAASTEIFSMYRNVALQSENNMMSVPTDVTPDKDEIFIITDDVKSHSSDHSDDDSDSKHCSEEEMEVLREDVKITSDNSNSLENDDSSSSKKSDISIDKNETLSPPVEVKNSEDDIDDKENSYSLENNDSSLSKKSDISMDKNENEVIDKNEALCPPVEVKNPEDNIDDKETLEKDKVLPRQSLRLQNKIESQNKNNFGENSSKDTSKPEKVSLQCNDTVPNDKHGFEIDYSGPDLENSHSIGENSSEHPSTSNSTKPVVDSQPVTKKDTKKALKDKSKNCKTPSKSYSLRKSSRRKDDSANLGIDLSKLVIDSPSSKNSSSRKQSKYVKLLTSAFDFKSDNESETKHSVTRETRSSTSQSEKESKQDQDPPSYNLRNRKLILTPARLKI